MKKKLIITITVIITALITILILLPSIKIDKNNQIKYLSYSNNTNKYFDISCYDDGIFYNKEKDISITGTTIKKKLFFYTITFDYKKGNLCANEYLLEESYLINILENAEIITNDKNLNIKELIKDKKAIVSNKRYTGNDYEMFIEYKLNGKYQILYVFYQDDLLVIQIGLSDETPKFIAYK